MDHAEPTQSINNAVKPSEHTDLGKPKGGIVEKKVSFYCRLSRFGKVHSLDLVSDI